MLDHSTWAGQMKAAMALKCKAPESAVTSLRSLARRTARQVKDGVTDWHVEQATSLAAIILAECAEHQAAALLCRRHNRHLKAQLTYYARALAGSLAFEAFELSASGQVKRAREVAVEAMGYFEVHPDSSATYKKLAELVRNPAPGRKSGLKRLNRGTEARRLEHSPKGNGGKTHDQE